MSEKTVFISYSHDSDAHREKVLALSERLRADGIETLLDRYVNGSPQQGWPRWMLDRLDAADSVLVVCTETYYRRFRGHAEPGKGKGVDWEGALITQEIYDARSQTLKFVPVLFAREDEKFIPEPLRAATHYTLTSESAYQSLYDFLLEQAGVQAQAVGVLKRRERAKGSPLSFGERPIESGPRIDISRIDKYAPAELIGREVETKLLNDAWDKAIHGETKRPHVLTFVALGGEGKTSLVAKWAADLAHHGWPGCEAAFAWSFYSQGTREQTVASSDLFLKEALTFFGDSEIAGSAQSPFDKGRRLAQIVGERRALLILDGLEPLQYAPTSPTPGELKDQGIAAMLKGLAVSNHGLCVVTTRYSIPDLRAYRQTTAPETKLTRLSNEGGAALLRSLGVKGAPHEFEKLVEDAHGHALTLNLLGAYLNDAHAGDARRRDLVKLEEADAEEQGGHAFRVMDAYVRWFEREGERGTRALALLRLLGLFDRPATADCLTVLQRAPVIPALTEALVGMSEAQWNLVFTRLETAKLLTVNRDSAGLLVSVDAHPLLREYFSKQLRTLHLEAWRAAHGRLYEHLCGTTPDKPWPTLEEIQPLYQAVAHGCHAGLQEEACVRVYFHRIQRGGEGYSSKKLGAFGSDLGAIACLFETPWTRVSPSLPETLQAWLLAEASYRLRALGRLTEALETMRATMKFNAAKGEWGNAAACACNMSELELVLGDVAAAADNGERSMTYADRGGDGFFRIVSRCTTGDALHQAGHRVEAEALFREAEELRAKRQPEYPLLYSMEGVMYCDLLLAAPERAAWQFVCKGGLRSHEELVSPSVTLQSVFRRATQTLKIAEDNKWLHAIALDYLTQGRAMLYEGILNRTSLDHCEPLLQNAVDRLRRAAQQQYLPLGLLSRAWLRSLTGVRTGPESAQADLDEAWEIAERGPMPLLIADIHLHRARLFGRPSDDGGVTKYPWDSPQADLAEARRLIEKHEYWRRKEELEDAEEAAKNWRETIRSHPLHSARPVKIPNSVSPEFAQVTASTPPSVQTVDLSAPPMSAQHMKTTVLFLGSNPDGVTRLALDKECRAIREKIRASDFPKELELKTEWAVRTDDLLQYLNEYRPHVVHFSGHGSSSEELILHDNLDQAKPVSSSALRAVFTALKDNIRLVVLNACYSRPQAEVIVEQIDCAVGMNKAIGDEAAIIFAASFYRALGFGRSVKAAFDQGCAALQLEGIPEEKTPELLVKDGVDASKLFLAGPTPNPT